MGIWRLLDLFEAHRFPVTRYAVGQALEKNPAAAEAVGGLCIWKRSNSAPRGRDMPDR